VKTSLSKKHDFDAVFDSQKVYRLVLEALSHPTKVVSIQEHANKLQGSNPAYLALAMTLLDNEVSFNTCENRQLSDEISSLTHATRTVVEEADFIFVSEAGDWAAVIEHAQCGSLANPHSSATVIVQNKQNGGAPLNQLTFRGPGIDARATVLVTQTVKEILELRDAQCYEYPQGIDLIFVSDEGALFAIPRLVSFDGASQADDSFSFPPFLQALRSLFEEPSKLKEVE